MNPNQCARCGGVPISADDCNYATDLAISNNLIDAPAGEWLRSHMFCPSVSMGARGRLYVSDICPLGCFDAETKVLASTATGAMSWTPADAVETNMSLFAMADNSSLESVELQARPLQRIVHGWEEPELYIFHLSNWRVLRVTQHHPMVLANGTIVEAAAVHRGASFLDIEGQPIEVLDITREETDKEVFNFWTASDTQEGHVIVAEGVLVGDLQLQNQLGSETQSIELRR
jgi:hypothetical protein